MSKKSTKRYFSASHAIAWKSCRRKAWYDIQPDKSPLPPDPFDLLIMQRGLDHESQVLERLDGVKEARNQAHTATLISKKTPVIYQARLDRDDLQLISQPDFLVLENDGYRVYDAKSSKSIKRNKGAQLQLAAYQVAFNLELRSRTFLPNNKTEEISDSAIEEVADFLSEMKEFVNGAERPQVHYSDSKCSACPHRLVCIPDLEAADDLGQNSYVDTRSIPGLRKQNIHTLTDLSLLQPESIAVVPYLKKESIPLAVLQAKSLTEDSIIAIQKHEPMGHPVIHFDIETYPMAKDGAGEIYLWGLLPPPYSEDDFEYIWSDGGDEDDRQAWISFLQRVEQFRQAMDDPRLVHYARFEVDQIRLYSRRYGMEQDPTVIWLLSDGLVDLLKIVKRDFILPVRSYGLKQICKRENLVNFQWELPESGSQWSVVRYLDFLNSSDNEERLSIKEEILSYNRDDVRATRAVEEWMAAVPS